MSEKTRKNIFVQLADRIHDLSEVSWLELNFATKLLRAEIPPEYHAVVLRELRMKETAVAVSGDGVLLSTIRQAIEEVERQKAEAEARKAKQTPAPDQVTDADKRILLLSAKVAAAKQAVRNVNNLAMAGSIGGEGQVSRGMTLGLAILGICDAGSVDGVQQALELSKEFPAK